MKNNGVSRRRYLFLPAAAAVLTAAVYLVYCAVFGFYPFGGRSFVWCDLEQQYLPLVMELKSVFSRSGSLFLGRGGGGMNFYGVFLFFVSSPLSLLTLAVDNADMLHFINVLTIIKASLAAAAAEVWFTRSFPKLYAPFGVLISMMYALSGYVMMYYQNNMWLDMMILFPILLLVQFRLFETGKWGMYSVCLVISMLLNFYISYMVVMYLILSGAVMLILCCDKDKRGDRALKLLIGDVCAALMSAVIWIPAFIQFSSSGRGSSTLRIFVHGSTDDNFFDKAALLSCTGLVLAAVIAAIIFRRRLLHGRPAFFALMSLLLLAAVFVGPANKIWHTGSYQAYPLRYGFIVILLVFSLCAELLQTAEPRGHGMNVFVGGALAMIFVLGAVTAVGIYHRDKLNSYSHTLWTDTPDALGLIGIGLAASVLYLILISGYISGKLNGRFTTFVMFFTLICESLLGFSVYFDGISDPSGRFTLAAGSLTEVPEEDSYSRVKVAKRFYYSNMTEGFGLASLGHYTSLTDGDLLFTAKRLGYSSYWMDSSACGGTVYSDAFLMNKYVVGQPDDIGAGCELVSECGVLNVYRNTLSDDGALICGTSPAELADFGEYERADSAEYLADKLYGVSGTVTSFEPVSVTGGTLTEVDGIISIVPDEGSEGCVVTYDIPAGEGLELYFDAFGDYSTRVKEDYFETMSVRVNGRLLRDKYPNSLFSGMIYLGRSRNEAICVTATVAEPIELTSFGVSAINAEQAAESIRAARTAPITVCRNRVTINADARSGDWLYIPMIMLNGYRAKVNGEPVELTRTLGAFMAVPLSEGGNEVELTFIPEGFLPGAVLSVIGAVLFAALMLLYRRRAVSGRLAAAAERIMLAAGALTFVAVYIISCAAWIVLRLMDI